MRRLTRSLAGSCAAFGKTNYCTSFSAHAKYIQAKDALVFGFVCLRALIVSVTRCFYQALAIDSGHTDVIREVDCVTV
jgi:hypothetical protein